MSLVRLGRRIFNARKLILAEWAEDGTPACEVTLPRGRPFRLDGDESQAFGDFMLGAAGPGVTDLTPGHPPGDARLYPVAGGGDNPGGVQASG